ncbi:hypothetical protein Brsp07_03811 [Brucella sp. NBRC 14130]
MGARELLLDQAWCGGRRADHGRKHHPGSGRHLEISCHVRRSNVLKLGRRTGSRAVSRIVLCSCGPRVLDTNRPITEVDPFKSGEFHCLEAPPWSTPMDNLGLVKTVDRFGEGVVVTVADASDGRLDSSFCQSLGIANGHVLNAPVRVMHEAAAMSGTPIMKSLLQGIEDKACMRRPARPPSNDATSEDVDDKGHVDEPLPGGEWSKKRRCASPPRTVRAPFSAYGSLFKLGPWP